jgi:hypothetical protein
MTPLPNPIDLEAVEAFCKTSVFDYTKLGEFFNETVPALVREIHYQRFIRRDEMERLNTENERLGDWLFARYERQIGEDTGVKRSDFDQEASDIMAFLAHNPGRRRVHEYKHIPKLPTRERVKSVLRWFAPEITDPRLISEAATRISIVTGANQGEADRLEDAFGEWWRTQEAQHAEEVGRNPEYNLADMREISLTAWNAAMGGNQGALDDTTPTDPKGEAERLGDWMFARYEREHGNDTGVKRSDFDQEATEIIGFLAQRAMGGNQGALVWTKEKPKVAGWFWMRRGSITGVRVFTFRDGKYCMVGFWGDAIENMPEEAEWAGPIPSPTESTP